MQVTTKQQVTIDLTVEEAAVLRRILGSTYEGKSRPPEVAAVMVELWNQLTGVPAVDQLADRYEMSGEIEFKGLAD